MLFFDEQLLVRARDFIHSCLISREKEEERPVVIAYHGDGDGCCAGHFLSQYVDRPLSLYWVPTPDFDFAELESYLLKEKPHLVILLDMPVYGRPEMIEELSSRGNVFIYDHHSPGICEVCDGKENVFYMNPVIDQNGVAFPTALFGWELLSEKDHFEREVLFMGLFTETWVNRVSLFEDFDAAYQDQLKEIAKRIHANFLIHDMNTTHYALNFLSKAASGGGSIIEQAQMMKEYQILENIYDLIQNEKRWLMKNLSAEIRKLAKPRFILKKIESRIRLCGLIASELRWRYPKLVIGVWQKWKQKYYCELRKGTECRVDLAHLIDRLKVETALTTGGGHPMAAAFTAERNAFFDALGRIKRYLVETEL